MTDNSLEELYQELLLDHFKHPRCCGDLPQASANFQMLNPLCGDQVNVMVKTVPNATADSKIDSVRFVGKGCSISQASASMMSSLLEGKNIKEARELIELFRSLMRNETSGKNYEVLGDVLALEGVKKFAARIRCAQLAWEAVDKCLDAVEKR